MRATTSIFDAPICRANCRFDCGGLGALLQIPSGSSIEATPKFANPSGFGLNLAQTPLDTDQQKLSDRMIGYWTEFAKSGNPNGSGPPVWQRFHRDRQVMLSLVPPTPTSETNFATAHQCDFWDTLTGRTLPPVDGHDQRAANN
jgi:para-nitrobenzyl esterase